MAFDFEEDLKSELEISRLDALKPIVQRIVEIVESEGFTIADFLYGIDAILDDRRFREKQKIKQLKELHENIARINCECSPSDSRDQEPPGIPSDR
ncbi:hypothetical protein H6G80_03895 [Nostoc sp. FACHB-87]|uniref:hypothetical protein n=1 Tax=Nostocaceae TaxID=1162 RepID=UPI0016896D4E|nr:MULTISPECIES: hypothetical protein [Nostocaceae]MBD2453217.1 hypothetical protein [Nostoc sp. FACHB-87]MBD2475004.1 hypothetical protein [Anabaena sp. FACHB-83]